MGVAGVGIKMFMRSNKVFENRNPPRAPSQLLTCLFVHKKTYSRVVEENFLLKVWKTRREKIRIRMLHTTGREWMAEGCRPIRETFHQSNSFLHFDKRLSDQRTLRRLRNILIFYSITSLFAVKQSENHVELNSNAKDETRFNRL